MEMELRIRFYGRLADAIAPEIELATGGCSISDLRSRIASDFPAAEAMLDRSRACVGDCMAGDEQQVADADVVEFLPPVSGG
jgi:molybdopterin converting factor small subunit